MYVVLFLRDAISNFNCIRPGEKEEEEKEEKERGQCGLSIHALLTLTSQRGGG